MTPGPTSEGSSTRTRSPSSPSASAGARRTRGLLPQARQICGEAGFAPYALPGSQALSANIAQTFAAGSDCVVLENHGVVTAGSSLQEAFERFETLEFTAKTVIKASLLGEVRYLDEAQAKRQPEKPAEPGPAFQPGPATSREKRAALATLRVRPPQLSTATND